MIEMVRSITPRGVGRPDNEREVHRVSLQSFQAQQELWSFSNTYNVPASSYRVVTLLGFDLPTEDWKFYLTDVIVTIDKSLRFLVDVAKNGSFIGSKWGMQNVHIKFPTGFPFSITDKLEIYIANYHTSMDMDISLYVGGFRELTGV